MPYYKTCPDCGANNDPGEICSCKDENEAAPLQRKRPLANHATPILTTDSENVKPVSECAAYA